MESGKHERLILEMQQDRLRWGWSYQYILELLEDRKDPVSMSTIRRVFTPGGEKHAYNYNISLRPIAELFYQTKQPTPERTPGDEEQAVEFREQIKGLKATIESKNEHIDALDRQIMHLESQKNEFKDAVFKRDINIAFNRRVLMVALVIAIILLSTNIVTMGMLIKLLMV